MITDQTLIFFVLILCIFAPIACHAIFNCTVNQPVYKGACSINSEKCCESVAGHECKRELSQNLEEFSPTLHFIKNSLTIQYRPNLPTYVCIEGAHIDNGTAFRGHETKGIFIQVSIRSSESFSDHVYSSTTLFPGKISRKALKNSLNCVEVDMSEDELALDTNYIQVQWVPLPPSPHQWTPIVYPHPEGPSTDNFIPICDVTNVDIYWNSCFKWDSRVLSTKACIRKVTWTTPDKPMVLEEFPVATSRPANPEITDSFWKSVALVLMSSSISCCCSFGIAICVFYCYKHRQRKRRNQKTSDFDNLNNSRPCASNSQSCTGDIPNEQCHTPRTLPDQQGVILVSPLAQSSTYVPVSVPNTRRNSRSTVSLEPGISLADSNSRMLTDSQPSQSFQEMNQNPNTKLIGHSFASLEITV